MEDVADTFWGVAPQPCTAGVEETKKANLGDKSLRKALTEGRNPLWRVRSRAERQGFEFPPMYNSVLHSKIQLWLSLLS